MRHKFSQCLLIVALLAPNAFAQGVRTSNTAPDAERLRAHVTYLASDKLDGRRTGTAGAEMAAQHIAEEFKRLGLRAGGQQQAISFNGKVGGKFTAYVQTFPYVAGVELGKTNSMHFFPRVSEATASVRPASLDLRVREDWMPLGWSANGRVESLPLTFVGYGISAGDLNHDDYAGANVAGRVALALAGTPEGDNPHGQFARYAELRFKAAAARDRGAKALVVISGEENFQDERLARLRYDHGGGDAGLPVVVISRQVARRIFEASGVEPSFDKSGKPVDAASIGSANKDAPDSGGDSRTPPPRFTSVNLPNVAFSIAVDVARRETSAHNVVGLLEGSDPKLKNEAIIVGAHYDHLGRGGQGSLAVREGEIHHGADDNASGVAGLLELARLFSQGERGRLRRTIVFIAFGGEEEGLLGSNFYINNPIVPLAQTVAMINMDMIGRLNGDRLLIGGAGTASEWKGWIARANSDPNIRMVAVGGRDGEKQATAKSAGAEIPAIVGANGQVMATASPRQRFSMTLNEDGFGPSDHSSFYAKKIPVLFFFTGTHEDYHKPSDTAEKINYEGVARVLSFVRDIVLELQASEPRPTYTVARGGGNAGRSIGFRVYLGTVPNYAESKDGMKLDAVRDDSPAAKAGLRAGDVIVKMAGREIRNVYDYTYALAEMKAGQEYEVEAMRDGQRLTVKITPAARK